MKNETNENLSQVFEEVNNTAENSGIDMDLYTQSKVSQSIPVLCFLFCLMLVGIAGNASVIVTYVKRLEKSTTHLFIFYLAVFNIINCLIIPKRIYDLLHPYTNTYNGLCSFQYFASYSTDISAGIIIVCISFDRYFRIARPHHGLSVRRSKIAIIVIFFSSMIFSSMTFFVNGTEQVKPDSYKSSVFGYKCGILDSAKQTVLPLLFNVLVLVCFVLGVIVLLTVYILLGLKVRRWNEGRKNKQRGRIRSDNTQVTSLTDETESSKESQAERHAEECKCNKVKLIISTNNNSVGGQKISNSPLSNTREISRSLERKQFTPFDVAHSDGTKTLPHRKACVFGNLDAIYIPRKSSVAPFTGLRRGMKVSRTTTMFISATVAFVASHVPFICFKLVNTLNPDVIRYLSPVISAIVMFADYSYMISYVVNPIIYSFMNPKYRREVKTLLLNVSTNIICKTSTLNIRR